MKKFLLSTLALFIAIVMNAAQVNLTWAGQSDWSGVAEKANIISLAADGFTITIDKSSGQTAPTVNASANDCRAYANNVITVSSTTGNMTEIVFNISSNGKKRLTDVTASEGTAVSDIDNQTVTWTGNAAEVTFTVGENATHGTDGASKAGQICFDSVDVTYTATAASSVATPTFTVEPGTFGEKKSVGIECATDGAVIYYTLDGTTPDNTSTPYEAAIELNSKTTVKAIAYVGEEASNVASATYDFKLEGSLTFVTAPILASDMQAKIEWTADWANNTVNYLVTYDGTEPTVDNNANTGTSKTRQLPMYSWKKDTVVVISIRPELDGIYGDTFTKTYYIKYAKTLDAYKAVSTMAAGNYVLVGENSVMLPIDGEGKDYGYGYAVDAAVSNGLVSAFGYFEFAFEATDGGYYIKDSKGQYLYAKGTYKSFNLSSTVPTTGGVWSVEIQANGQAKISNNETGRWIQWDSYYKNWAMPDGDQGSFMPTLAAQHVPTLEMTPAANATVETLDKIVLTCSDGIASASNMKYVSIQGTGVTASVTANQVDNNTLELVLSEPITTAGDYDFVFYKGCVTLGPGSLNQAHPATTEYITYTVGGGATPVELVVTPANESENKSLQHFTFTCEQGISINNLFGGQAPFLGYTDPATGASSQIALTPGMSTETSVTLSTEKVQTTEGIYTLVVPAEYFVLAGTQPNEAIMYQYLVAGGEEEVNPADLILDPADLVDADVTANIVHGRYTLVRTSKDWKITTSNSRFSRDPSIQYTYRVQPDGTSNYWTFDAPSAGTLYINVRTSKAEATDRNMVVTQDEKTLYDAIILEELVENAEYSKVYKTHEVVIPAAGLVTVTNPTGALNYHYMEFVPAGDTPATIEFLSVTPKEGPVTSLLNIQVITDTDLGEAEGLTLTDADGKEYSIRADVNDRVGEDNIYESIIITIEEEITAAGTYTLTIPAGKVVEYIEDMATQTPKLNAEKTYTWTIDANNGLAIVSTTPAEGAEVESFSEMIVEFNKEIWIGNAFTGASAFVVKDANGETVTSCLTEIVDPIGSHPAGFGTVQTGTKVRVYADEEVTTAGNYQLIIPANTVKTADDTEVFPETAINFTVAEAANTLAIVKTTPANGETVDYIYEVQVEVSEPVYFDSFNGTQPYLLNANGEKLVTFGIDYPNYTGFHQGALGKFYLSKNLLFFLSSPIKDAGNYQIVIPANSFKTDDDAQSLPETIINVTIEAQEALAVVSSENTDKGITIKFNKEIQVVSGLFGGGQFVVYDQWGMNYGACSVSVNDDKTSLYAEFSETLVPDSYKIVIPDNTVKTADGSETLAATPINFTVSEAAPVITATWSIEEGTTIEEFESVTVTFAGADIESVNATNSYACIWFYEKDANGNYNLVTNQCTDGYLDATASGTTLTLGADPGCYSDDWTSPFNRKGDYRIVIPAGGVYFNGDKANANTEEYVLNFTIYNDIVELEEIDATFVADPEDNSTISEIKEIVITFPEYETIAVGEPDMMTGSNIPTVSMVDEFTGAAMPAGFIMFRAGDAANQLVLYVDPAYTGGMDSYAAEGQYVINIPAKVVTFSNGINKAFQLNYTVGQVNEELAIVSTTPAEGAEVESFSEMIVEYNKPVWFTSFGNAKLKDAEGTTVATLSHEMLESVGNHTTWNGSTPLAYKVRFYTDNAITTDGNYSVEIEKETFATDDASEYSEKATINFSVKYVAPSAIELVATDPAEGATISASEFESILTTWNMDIDMTYDGAEAYLLDAEGNRVATASGSYVFDASHTCIDNQLNFVFNTPITNAMGTYTFVIEAGYIWDMTTYSLRNEEIRITFELNQTGGIKGIEMDPVHGYVVYDFSGILVMQTRNAADLERLNNGLYIINGVKILINK